MARINKKVPDGTADATQEKTKKTPKPRRPLYALPDTSAVRDFISGASEDDLLAYASQLSSIQATVRVTVEDKAAAYASVVAKMRSGVPPAPPSAVPSTTTEDAPV